MKRLLPLVISLMPLAPVFAQCVIQAPETKICIGSSASFSLSPLTASDSAFVWTFGDNGSSTQASPTYQYASTGSFTVKARKYFFGGTFCDAPPVTVTVFALPVASYMRVSPYIRCFEGNAFSFTDQSQPGPSQAPLAQRTIVFDDGAFQQESPPYTAAFNHAYTNPAGGKYKVVLEVKDTNGCIKQFLDSVVVHPKMPDPGFRVVYTERCGLSDAVFTQNGSYHASNVNRLRWITGTGDTLDAPPFNNLSYRYLQPGVYKPRLLIEDRNGCMMDTASWDSVIVIVPPDPNIYFDTLANGDTIRATQCFQGNGYSLYNPTLGYAWARWTILGAGADMQHYPPGARNSFVHSFAGCGPVSVRMEMEYYGCRIVADTMLHVLGPKAILEADTVVINRKEQCPPFDTILFRYRDINCYHGNPSVHYLWDFKDAFAPPCTTDTRAGLHVYDNCNYSVDSLPVKHLYSQPSAACLWPSLLVTDSVTGCASKDSVELRMSAPRAGPDSTTSPPLRGVTYSASCNEVIFDLTGLLPFCGPEQVYLLPDSSCFPHNWLGVSSKGNPAFYPHPYTGSCSGDSVFTYGIVTRNGKNRFGVSCYDTAWYRGHFYTGNPPRSAHTLLSGNTCRPFSVRFSVPDSFRSDVARVSWYFGDGSPNYTVNYTAPGDTVIRSFEYQYQDTGIFVYSFFYTARNGCFGFRQDTLYFGKYISMDLVDDSICYTDPVRAFSRVFYYGDPEGGQWNDPQREAADLERVYWNYGDDSTWIPGGTASQHFYDRPGIYTIRAVFKDSTAYGCPDTLQATVYVFGIDKRVYAQNDTFFCAPTIVTFIDSSVAVLNDTIEGAQFIASRLWEFNPLKPSSTLQKAVIYYPQNGHNEVKLTINTVMGCTVDTTINLVILGPSPRFVILEDTFGCAPFRVKLRNDTGKQLLNWIWQFNDTAGASYSTGSDTNMTFTYYRPGVYRIDLVGEDRIYNPTTNSYSYCSEKFPYLENPGDFHPRQVTVLKTDTMSITIPDSVCIGQAFTAQAGGAHRVSTVKWSWGDSTSEEQPYPLPATHSYDTGGYYTIRVDPVITARDQCAIGSERMIRVQQPLAEFTYDSTSYPVFRFTNESEGAVRYVWDFGQPSSSANSSTEEHPAHDYGSENSRFTVCLMAFDGLGCMDSVCRELPVRSGVRIPNVFTPGNADGKNDAFDIDIYGWEKYELYIYNRWGTLVFEGHTDGTGNDGINWNGKDKNTGSPCPEGVYYVIFRYRLFVPPSDEVYHGTVTLIRD